MFARCGIYGELSQENLTKEIELMEQISEDLREHSKKFISYINNQIQKNELSRIFEVLNKEEQIVNLLPNKKEQTAISTFYEEFSLYQFKIYQIANYATFEECTLDDIAASDTANDENGLERTLLPVPIVINPPSLFLATLSLNRSTLQYTIHPQYTFEK